jgi:hypothetical protein
MLGRLLCGLVSRYGMGEKVVQSTQADRHLDRAMGQRTLKYADRLLRHMTRTFHHQPYPCGHRPHDTAASPGRFVLAVAATCQGAGAFLRRCLRRMWRSGDAQIGIHKPNGSGSRPETSQCMTTLPLGA